MSHQAIRKLYPNAVSIDDALGVFDKDGKQIVIDKQAVKIESERLSVINEVMFKRAMSYPSIQDQLDMQYWDSVNGTTTWQDAINAVKVKYPKPEGV